MALTASGSHLVGAAKAESICRARLRLLQLGSEDPLAACIR